MGMAIIYGLKVNLSLTIVAMVNHTYQVELTSHESVVEEEEDTCYANPKGIGGAAGSHEDDEAVKRRPL